MHLNDRLGEETICRDTGDILGRIKTNKARHIYALEIFFIFKVQWKVFQYYVPLFIINPKDWLKYRNIVIPSWTSRFQQ